MLPQEPRLEELRGQSPAGQYLLLARPLGRQGSVPQVLQLVARIVVGLLLRLSSVEEKRRSLS